MNERFSIKCPRCVQKVAPGLPSCSHCGYALSAACALYGAEAVVAERLMDVEGVLEPGRRGAVMEALEGFERTFPQLFLLVYLGPLPAPASPRQFAFWMLNHAAVPDLAVTQPNERGLLLVVDPHAGTAVLAGGYFIETFICQEELDDVLRTAARDLGRADYAAAVKSITSALRVPLAGKAKEAARHPERFQPLPVLDSPPASFPPLARTGETAAPEPAEAPAESVEVADVPAVSRKPPGRGTRRAKAAAVDKTPAPPPAKKPPGRPKSVGKRSNSRRK